MDIILKKGVCLQGTTFFPPSYFTCIQIIQHPKEPKLSKQKKRFSMRKPQKNLQALRLPKVQMVSQTTEAGQCCVLEKIVFYAFLFVFMSFCMFVFLSVSFSVCLFVIVVNVYYHRQCWRCRHQRREQKHLLRGNQH